MARKNYDIMYHIHDKCDAKSFVNRNGTEFAYFYYFTAFVLTLTQV